jgi:hypothetical protein
MRLAIPNDSLYTPITRRAEELAAASQGAIVLRRGTEEECEQWLANNLVDAALVSIAAYGRASVVQDYRIVPSTLCVLMGWTNAGSILFAENIDVPQRAAASNPAQFLTQAAVIVLDEQYDISLNIEKVSEISEKTTSTYECVIATHSEIANPRGMDISEEWDMAFSYPLPLVLWVCRNEYVLDAGSETLQRMEEVLRSTRLCADENLEAREARYEQQSIGDADLRDGIIQWIWSDDILEALQQTLQLLFYRQLLSDIPEIKVLGRDEEPLGEEPDGNNVGNNVGNNLGKTIFTQSADQSPNQTAQSIGDFEDDDDEFGDDTNDMFGDDTTDIFGNDTTLPTEPTEDR